MNKVFKAYDIRGIYPEEINEKLFEDIGSCFTIFNAKKVVVGSDMRLSSNSLRDSLINGFLSSGIDVIDIGLASTPMIYQASNDFDVDFGIIITASHNPKEYNGMKICKKNAVPVAFDSGIQELRDAVKTKSYRETKDRGTLEIIENYKETYAKYLKSFVDVKKKLKVVFDPGNGMGAFIDKEILNEICELVPLYATLDGTFPNHEADPLKPENLEDLQKKVIEQKADFGIAFDGDADRVGFVDNKGEFIGVDYVGAYMIEKYIEQNPNELNYSYDLRSSKIVEEVILKYGKIPHKTRVGHSYIKQEMRKDNSYFSTELSGHLYFRFNEGVIYDSAIRSSIEIISMVSKEKGTFSEIMDKYKKYVKSPEINFLVKDKEKKIEEIKNNFSDAKIENIDGITIIYDDWWFNIRVSNTEDKLRLNFEADSKELFEEKLGLVKSLIES